MPRLNKRERRLIWMLGITFFIVINLIALTFLSRQRTRLKSALFKLQGEKIDAGYWRGEGALWDQRGKWLEEKQPKLVNLEEGNVRLLEDVQTSARKHNIKIADQSLLDPQVKPFYEEIRIQLRVTGKLEDTIKWLNELQRPESFHAINAFSMQSDTDATLVKCDLQVSRLYAKKPLP